jgi:hypothetical protein
VSVVPIIFIHCYDRKHDSLSNKRLSVGSRLIKEASLRMSRVRSNMAIVIYRASAYALLKSPFLDTKVDRYK